MAYGDYDGPDKADKGKEGGSCNRRRCQCSPASYYNHGMYEWYCKDCAVQIGHDPVNYAHWMRYFYPRLKHPQFETREQMDARQSPAPLKREATDAHSR